MPRVGTVSWQKEDWAGTFYPPRLPREQWLSQYAKSFDTVEVDATFYRMPTVDLCRAWRMRTPDDFRFALKMPRRITHDKALKDCEQDLERFHAATKPLGDKLAFAVLQFRRFGPKSACPDLKSFLARLAECGRWCDPERRYAIEVRNPDWLGPELFEFLRERRFVLVLAEVEGMPNPRKLWDEYGDTLATGGAVYVRVFGDRKKMETRTQTFGRLLVDRTRETSDWVRVCREMESKNIPTWVYFSNYFAGFAPGSAELFRKFWKHPTAKTAKRAHPKAG